MSGLLRDDFSPKRPITQVPTAWFNAVAKTLNGITAGVGININKNGTDTAGWEFELDLEFARKYLGIEGGGGKPTDLTHEDITDWDAATANFLTQGDLDGYATEAEVDAVSDLVLDLTDVVDGILADYVSEDELTTTLSFYSNTETIANTYATKTELTEVDGDLADLADYVADMDTDLADLLDWAYQVDADIYDESGNLNFVTTNTFQLVTAEKNFTNSLNIVNQAEKYFYVENTTTGGKCWLGNGTLWLNQGNNTIYFRDAQSMNRAWVSNISNEYLEFYHAKYGGVLKWDGHNLIFPNGSHLFDSSSGIGIVNQNLIQLNSKADGVALVNHPAAPTFSCSLLSVPTVGWTELYFQRKANTSQDVHYYDLVKDVTWDGTRLVVQKSQMCVSFGSIVSITDYQTPQYINTVTYTP